MFSASATSFEMPPLTRTFSPAKSSSVRAGRFTVKRSPGPVANTVSTLRPWNSVDFGSNWP